MDRYALLVLAGILVIWLAAAWTNLHLGWSPVYGLVAAVTATALGPVVVDRLRRRGAEERDG